MLKKRLVSMGLAATMAMSMGLTAMASEAGNVSAQANTYDVYFVADPTLVDADGFAYEPMKVSVSASDSNKTFLQIIDSMPTKVDYLPTDATSYISAIKCADADNFTLTTAAVAALGLDGTPYNQEGIRVLPADVTNGYLAEKEFSGYSGWMFTLDNETTGVRSTQPDQTYYYTMGSTIKELEECGVFDGDNSAVIQMFFSFNMGADIGMGAASLPLEVESATGADGTTSYWYNWSGSMKTVESFKRADSTVLVKALADTKKATTSTEYIDAIKVLKNLRSTSTEISVAAKML